MRNTSIRERLERLKDAWQAAELTAELKVAAQLRFVTWRFYVLVAAFVLCILGGLFSFHTLFILLSRDAPSYVSWLFFIGLLLVMVGSALMYGFNAKSTLWVVLLLFQYVVANEFIKYLPAPRFYLGLGAISLLIYAAARIFRWAVKTHLGVVNERV